MSVSTSKLPDFPGFGIYYDPKQKPFFKAQVIEVMRKIESVQIGKDLFKSIKEARPRARKAANSINSDAKMIHFPKGVNVVITPARQIQFIQSGMKAQKDWGNNGAFTITGLVPSTADAHNRSGCPFHIDGGSAAMAIDPTAGSNGTGCCSIMYFTNAQIITGKGEAANPAVVLAHELIHCLHHVTGTCANTDEELITTGIGQYAELPVTENAFRKAFGYRLRSEYY
jgi:hypothetical protein